MPISSSDSMPTRPAIRAGNGQARCRVIGVVQRYGARILDLSCERNWLLRHREPVRTLAMQGRDCCLYSCLAAAVACGVPRVAGVRRMPQADVVIVGAGAAGL